MSFVHIISTSRLKTYSADYPNAQSSLQTWLKLVSKANWQNLAETRKTFPSADSVKNFTVFNIAGNRYRLITYIDYESKKIFIRDFLTHADYDKDKWKHDPWFQ
jgi:mRNA interferase HigB